MECRAGLESRALKWDIAFKQQQGMCPGFGVVDGSKDLRTG